jgi:hypothetical protein
LVTVVDVVVETGLDSSAPVFGAEDLVSVTAGGAADERHAFFAKYPAAPSRATFNASEMTKIGFGFIVSMAT